MCRSLCNICLADVCTLCARVGLFTERGSYLEDTRPTPHGATWAFCAACSGFRQTARGGRRAARQVQGLPNRNALSPERFWVRVSLAVANSSPMKPIRISQVRMANFLFSFCCSFGLALLVHDVHECLNFPAVYRHFHIFLVVKFRKALIKVKAFFIGFRDFPDGNGKSLTPFRFNGQVRTYF